MAGRKYYLFLCLSLFLCQIISPSISNAKELSKHGTRTEENAFGFEFFKKISGKRIFTKDGVTFRGRGDLFLTETQKVNIDINLDVPDYDIGIFYRWKELKFGWIPSALTEKCYEKDVVGYNQPFGEWPLGGYDITIRTYNLFYLELYGFDLVKKHLVADTTKFTC